MGISDTVGAYSAGKRAGEWLVYAPGRRYEIKQLLYQSDDVIGIWDSVQLQHLADSLRDVYQKDSTKAADHVFTRVQHQADFVGGSMAWRCGYSIRWSIISTGRRCVYFG
jgi:hypothetical protein